MQKGDQIRFLDAVGGGTVIQYDAARQLVWVTTDDGFDVGPLPASQCVVCSAQANYQLRHTAISRAATQAAQETPPAPTPANSHTPGKRPKRQRDEHLIDLHLEALPANGSGMTDVEKHQYQLRYFRMMMQQHLRHRGRRVVVIHLRQADPGQHHAGLAEPWLKSPEVTSYSFSYLGVLAIMHSFLPQGWI